MSLTASVALSVTGSHTNPLDLGTVAEKFAASASHNLTSGVASGMADRVFSDERTLAASATEDLDLAGVLLDGFGATITFATIKQVIIIADEDNVNNVNVTRPATLGVPLFLAAGDGLPIKPGGYFGWGCKGAGVTVTPGTGDLITLTNSGGTTSVTYKIVIIGTST